MLTRVHSKKLQAIADLLQSNGYRTSICYPTYSEPVENASLLVFSLGHDLRFIDTVCGIFPELKAQYKPALLGAIDNPGQALDLVKDIDGADFAYVARIVKIYDQLAQCIRDRPEAEQAR